MFIEIPQLLSNVDKTTNLFMTSKNETTNSPNHEFKVLNKGQILNDVLFLIYYFKKLTLLFHFRGIKRHFAALQFVNW